MVLNKRLHVRSGNGKGVVEPHGWNKANKSERWKTQGKAKWTNDWVKVCFMYRKVAKTKRHFAEDFALSEFYLVS